VLHRRSGQPGASGNAHDVCTESEIKQIAGAMRSNGLRVAGYRYIMLDDCWAATLRTDGGELAADRRRFPSGNGTLAELAAWLHGNGDFLLGVYTAAGNETCSAGGRNIPGEPNARGVPGSCDGVTAAVCLPQYQRDADTMTGWGIDAVKLDWCKFNGTITIQENLTLAFGEALIRTQRPTFLSFHCGAPWHPWCAKPGNARAWRIYKDHHDVWDGTQASTSSIIDVLGLAATHSRPYAWADPDLLMTGGAGCDIRAPGVRCPNQTDTEYRTEFSLWAMAAAPLVVSTDVRKLTPLMREILLHEELLAINQDKLGRSNGVVEASPCAGSTKPNACQWWSKPLEDGSMAVSLYNSVNQTATNLPMPIHLLFHGGGEIVKVRDVWARKDLGEFHNFSAEVVGHGARVFVVRQSCVLYNVADV
jgi:alpha-galactosidase